MRIPMRAFATRGLGADNRTCRCNTSKARLHNRRRVVVAKVASDHCRSPDPWQHTRALGDFELTLTLGLPVSAVASSAKKAVNAVLVCDRDKDSITATQLTQRLRLL